MIQIAICDCCAQDALHLKAILQEIMEKYGMDYNIQEFRTGEELVEAPLAVHLIFLDIVMNGSENGIEIAKQVYRKNKTVKIIFQTYFSEYCKEAVNKSHAFAFLEKPLQVTVVEEQIKELLVNNEWEKEISIEFRGVKSISEGREELRAAVNLPVREIVYFEYLKLRKEIKIVTDKGTYIYSEAMNKLEERVRPFGFVTSCRGILVNIERIKRIKGYNVLLDNDSVVPLSQRRVSEFKESFKKYTNGL